MTTMPEDPKPDRTKVAGRIMRMVELGKLDDWLDEIALLVNYRRNQIRRSEGIKTLAQLEIGDRFQIKGNIRPLYLQGIRGKILERINRTQRGMPLFKCQLDHAAGKFYGGIILLTVSSIDLLPKED